MKTLLSFIVFTNTFVIQASDYFPMGENDSWEYQATYNNGDKHHCSDNGKITRYVVEPIVKGKKSIGAVFNFSPYCWGDSKVTYRRTQNYITVDDYRMLKFPAVIGDVWSAGYPSGAKYTWLKHYASYEVAGGTFTDCWEHKQIGHQVGGVYCIDIGPIVIYQKAWDIDIRWELLEYNPGN